MYIYYEDRHTTLNWYSNRKVSHRFRSCFFHWTLHRNFRFPIYINNIVHSGVRVEANPQHMYIVHQDIHLLRSHSHLWSYRYMYYRCKAIISTCMSVMEGSTNPVQLQDIITSYSNITFTKKQNSANVQGNSMWQYTVYPDKGTAY